MLQLRLPPAVPVFALHAGPPFYPNSLSKLPIHIQSGQRFSTVTGMICSQKQGSPHSNLRHRLRNLSFFWDHAAATTCPALPHTLAAEESLSGKKSGAETGTRSLHHSCTALIYLGRLSDYHQCFKSSTFLHIVSYCQGLIDNAPYEACAILGCVTTSYFGLRSHPCIRPASKKDQAQDPFPSPCHGFLTRADNKLLPGSRTAFTGRLQDPTRPGRLT